MSTDDGQPIRDASTKGVPRRQFLKATGGLVLAAAAGPSVLAACTGKTTGGGGGTKTLKILQWSHFVPAYDTWFDKFAADWGKDKGVTVSVDHIDNAQLPARTAAEVSAGRGHDLIEWIVPPSAQEPSVIDVKDLVQEAEGKYGDQFPFCKNSSYNPTTKKYYGFCHTWTPDPGDYRKSLWESVGMPNGPATWDELLAGGTEIKKKKKVRMGIGMSQEVDSNMAARALIWSFGGSIQDENQNVVVNSPQVIDAVEYMAKLFKQSMTNEVFSWTAASNNQGLIAGELSYILNSISAYRSAQASKPEVAKDVFFVPALKGPGGKNLACEHVVRNYIIPQFSKNVDNAKEFIMHLVDNAKDAVYNSQLYDFSAFKKSTAASSLPGYLDSDPFKSQPLDKLSLLKTAEQWSTNVGYPGPASPAEGEVFTTFVIPNMMASVARGQKTAKQAVADAEGQIKAIFAKWRKLGLVGGTS